MPNDSAAAAARRRWRAFSATYTAAVIAALILANVAGVRASRSWDLTLNRMYTLAPQTVEVLKELKQPVDVIAFVTSDSSFARPLEDLVRAYQHAVPGRVRFQAIDPTAHPSEAQKYGVTEADEVVVAQGGHREVLHSWDFYGTSQSPNDWNGEAALTSAILRVAHPETLKVYFLEGHGELAEDRELYAFSQALRDQGYDVLRLNLLQQPAVPDDAAVLVIAAPQHDLQPAEADAVRKYAAKGGHILVMRDPSDTPLPHLDALLKEWGVTPQRDYVIDPARHYLTDPTALIPQYGYSPIVQPLDDARVATVFPAAGGLDYDSQRGRVTPLLTTSDQAWGETDFKNAASFSKGTDRTGPLTVAVAVDGLPGQGAGSSEAAPGAGAGKGFRAVVFGGSVFATQQWFGIQGNHDLLLNAAGWLSGRQEGVTLRPKPVVAAPMAIDAAQATILMIVTVVLLPLLALGAGALVWWRRRRL
ncbi:MAG: GldG family protein [Firmicutes bacterium]|nr:GldG family protein [Bacillota bacterium]